MIFGFVHHLYNVVYPPNNKICWCLNARRQNDMLLIILLPPSLYHHHILIIKSFFPLPSSISSSTLSCATSSSWIFIIISLFYYYTAHLTFYFHFPNLNFLVIIACFWYMFVARDELENCFKFSRTFCLFTSWWLVVVVWFLWFTFTWFHVIYGDPPLMQNVISV